jgi:hypothetical protein
MILVKGEGGITQSMIYLQHISISIYTTMCGAFLKDKMSVTHHNKTIIGAHRRLSGLW